MVPLADGAKGLARAEAIGLLAAVPYGRVIFTLDALPAVRPVNHFMHEGQIIIRARLNPAISAAERSIDGIVVAYQADDFDAVRQTGWSVTVTGRAHTLADQDQMARYERLLDPWVNHVGGVVAIDPAIVTGFRISSARYGPDDVGGRPSPVLGRS
ncbi:MAG: pyridoxamine 5'-phosphate oxidase family protein [Mycobacterium sp.]